ncbi:MAG: glycoside hydrolase family 32 protein [Saprospiraceae bacterium]|nr:glycoside hydrolase family 32 protein [Saprospiraceae bacterium]
MKNAGRLYFVLASIFFSSTLLVESQSDKLLFVEPHRPKFHFSPQAHWMNDPNGMIFYKGTYHLFFQYYPEATVWGPMHWGHATSRDMVHWKEQSIKLYPDSLGYIFSGSTVLDRDNSSELGKPGIPPLVAIFTHHHPGKEKSGSPEFEYQSLAYSTDEGSTWTKYMGNPVLKNPGLRDFRDPKVSWYAPGKKWIMTLAIGDRIGFYSSTNLKIWSEESEFGKNMGSHGGVWECPDLFALEYKRKKVWVLLVSINSGGPNGGSATQYFTGQFDGKNFTPSDTTTRFIDYGTDNYAGVTFSNTGKRKVFMGWMSNWQYAQVVPTIRWRSAMTIPRELSITPVKNKLYLASTPVKEFRSKMKEKVVIKDLHVRDPYLVHDKIKTSPTSFSFQISTGAASDFSIILGNPAGEKISFGYNRSTNQYFVDRTQAGKIDFHSDFGKIHYAPRLTSGPIHLTLIADAASIEIFADHGLTVMTDIFFPNQPMNKLTIQSIEGIEIKKMIYHTIE